MEMDRTTLAHYVQRANQGKKLVSEIEELTKSNEKLASVERLSVGTGSGSFLWTDHQNRGRLQKSIREAISIAIEEEIALLETELADL